MDQKIKIEVNVPSELGLTDDDVAYMRDMMIAALRDAAEERVLYWKRLIAFIRQEV